MWQGRTLIAIVIVAVVGPGCAREGRSVSEPATSAGEPILQPGLAWHGDNRERLEAMIARNGSASAGYDSEHPPVAIFDWDNTMIRNDIGDAYFAWLLNNDKVLRPDDWIRVSPWLRPAARQVIEAACGEGEAGRPLLTSTDLGCADEIFAVYETGHVTTGQAAFVDEGYDHRRHVPRLAWPVHLQAGYTADELKGFAGQAVEQALAAEVGATMRVGGSYTMPAWIRIYDQTRDLMRALGENGFDVWVVSASPQPAVRAFAEHVTVEDDHVVGIRSALDPQGRLTYDLEGCGPVGPGENALVTFAEGKRCWINKAIFGDTSAQAIERRSGNEARPFFVAGDADTDVSMLVDAVGLRLVINRNKPEVMCRAYHDADGRWLINPMFLEPLPRAEGLYHCASTACFDARGAPQPCLDEAGAPIPDQADRIHGAGGEKGDEGQGE